jgi:RHS repeat-associated protein
LSLQRQTNFSVSDFRVPIRNTADYSPFGVQLDGRTIQGDFYRRGFNGMEKDDEVKGGGNSYTTEFRQYDSRVGRWLSLDPMDKKYPSSSPYSAFNNNPVYFKDPKGLEGEDPKSSKKEKGAGNKELKLPQDAVIKGRFVDKDKNGVINHGKKILDAKPGDVDRFSIGDKDYVANFDSKGDFNGYVDKAGEMYSFKSVKSGNKQAKIDAENGFELKTSTGTISSNGLKLETSVSSTLKESENGITLSSDLETGEISTTIKSDIGTLSTDSESFTFGSDHLQFGFTKSEEFKVSIAIPVPWSNQSLGADLYLDTKRWKNLGKSIMKSIEKSNQHLYGPMGGFLPGTILCY